VLSAGGLPQRRAAGGRDAGWRGGFTQMAEDVAHTRALGDEGATRFHSGVKLCAAPNFPAERLEQLALDRLAEKVLEPTCIRANLEKVFGGLEEHRKADDARVRVLASEQGLTSERLVRLYEAVEAGGLRTDSNLAERIAMYQKKHQHLAGQIAEIKRSHRIPLKKYGDNHVLALAGAMRDKILQPDSRIAKPYMRLLVKEIWVFEDRIRLEGSNAALASATSRTELGTEGSVPSFVSEWRARQDSNPRPPGS
jgi:site-specific DNA recombinase